MLLLNEMSARQLREVVYARNLELEQLRTQLAEKTREIEALGEELEMQAQDCKRAIDTLDDERLRQLTEQQQRAERAEAQLIEWDAALIGYGQHLSDCTMGDTTVTCSCGWDQYLCKLGDVIQDFVDPTETDSAATVSGDGKEAGA